MAKIEDLVGKIYGKLTVVSFGEIKNKKTYWKCKCLCGKSKLIRADGLKKGVKSCGCLTLEKAKEYENLVGNKYGRLEVLCENGRNDQEEICWWCLCDCGKEVSVRGGSLRSGHTHSCGCLQKESAIKQAYDMGKANTKHGMTHTREYETWHHIKQRCTDKNNPNYTSYGAKGIIVCDRWMESFENFYEDMGPKPSDKHQIDRIDSLGNYEPQNCRWVTPTEQQRNRKDNVQIEYNGKTQCMSAWAEEYGLTTLQLWGRLRLGWPIHESLTWPIAKNATEKFKYNRLIKRMK